MGANDVFGLISDPADAAAKVVETIDGLATDFGIRDFVVFSLPDQGETPQIRARGPDAQALVTARSLAFNAAFAGGLEDLEAADPALNLYRIPVFELFNEVLADPGYGIEHSGDTTGGDALIILSGPAIGRLGFNCENGALRDGYRANTSVGRFLRLFQRNVAGFLPGAADKSTFGHTFRVVLAEHEAAAAELGWPTFGADRGFAPNDSVVTIGRFTAGGTVGSIYGKEPEQILAYLADGLVRQTSWEFVFTVGFAPDTYRPLLVLSPMVARTLTRAGLSKADVRDGLFRHARLPAEKLETYIGLWSNLVPGRPSLAGLVAAGKAAPIFAESDDPARPVPIVARADDILLVVSGDPLRSNAYAFASNGMHGFPTSRRIRWPAG